MALVYVCTEYGNDGPSHRERARIGLLLSCLYARIKQIEDFLSVDHGEAENKKWTDELLFVQTELATVASLIHDKSLVEIIRELEAQYE